MKAPRASCEGYLTLRTSPSSPPPMLRRYCFLVGTCFYYYRCVRVCVEVVMC